MRGETSGSEMPHSAHASFSEKIRTRRGGDARPLGAPGSGLHLHHAVGQLERGRERIREARPEVLADNQPVDHHFNRVLLLVEIDLVAQLVGGPVDPHV